MIRNLLIFFIFQIGLLHSQIPVDRILENHELIQYIKTDVADLILKDSRNTPHDALLSYLQDKYISRYYFSGTDFKSKLDIYQQRFPNQQKKHNSLAKYHVSRYAADAKWTLPYINLHNEQVTAYELRHLARQQKSLDMALMHYYQNKNSDYIDYFVQQVSSLNKAFVNNTYDNAGNGVYEVFRAGKRIHNWLFCHAAYLSDTEYSKEKQSLLIRTFLHHGAVLFKKLPIYKKGNHHTKGLVALFEIATMFSDFIDSEKWQNHAISGIIEHMRNEINNDGFQFERSIHYHKGDIENYFRVYQLAKRSEVELPDEFNKSFQKMFDALIIMAQPNRKLPVWQDDTDMPYSENNEMADVFYLAKIMFNNPEYGYFSTSLPPVKYYWLMNTSELMQGNKEFSAPNILSSELPQTGYYVMRDGWNDSALQMVFSAGLSKGKPDHQHGDMLGITAFGLNTELLPNYQVAYKYPDLPYWKNSWAKNVALVDSQLQGKGWLPNSGGSGFGIWKILPEPTVLKWIKSEEFDYIAASHNGFENIGINYSREVIFIKKNYWLVIDNFIAKGEHNFQQVWQGNYQVDLPVQVSRKIAENGKFYIRQLNKIDYIITKSEVRKKENLVFSTVQKDKFKFTTLLDPVLTSEDNPVNLIITNEKFLDENFYSDADDILKAGDNYLLLHVANVDINSNKIQLPVDCKVLLTKMKNEIHLTLLHPTDITMTIHENFIGTSNEYLWKTGETKVFEWKQKS